jgi:eukaryotic-like serine/threonine-protein kinase
MIALIANDAQSAKENFQAASDKAATVPDIDENARLALKQRLAFSNIRLGNGAEAERLFRDLIAAYTRNSGPDSAEVLRVRLNLAQAFMIQNKNAEAVDETYLLSHPQPALPKPAVPHDPVSETITAMFQPPGLQTTLPWAIETAPMARPPCGAARGAPHTPNRSKSSGTWRR